MNLYVAYAIDSSSEKTRSAAESLVADLLREMPSWEGLNLAVYLPGKAFSVKLGEPPAGLQRVGDWIVQVNQTALERADALLVLYSPGVESWGTPQEMLLAMQQDKPIFVFLLEKPNILPIYLLTRVKPSNVFTKLADLQRMLLEYC
jgi:hypothetical protein